MVLSAIVKQFLYNQCKPINYYKNTDIVNTNSIFANYVLSTIHSFDHLNFTILSHNQTENLLFTWQFYRTKTFQITFFVLLKQTKFFLAKKHHFI